MHMLEELRQSYWRDALLKYRLSFSESQSADELPNLRSNPAPQRRLCHLDAQLLQIRAFIHLYPENIPFVASRLEQIK